MRNLYVCAVSVNSEQLGHACVSVCAVEAGAFTQAFCMSAAELSPQV